MLWQACSGFENGLYSWCMNRQCLRMCTQNSCHKRREKKTTYMLMENIPYIVVLWWLVCYCVDVCVCVSVYVHVCVYVRTCSALNVLNMWYDSWIHSSNCSQQPIYTFHAYVCIYRGFIPSILERILTSSTLQANVFHIQYQPNHFRILCTYKKCIDTIDCIVYFWFRENSLRIDLFVEWNERHFMIILISLFIIIYSIAQFCLTHVHKRKMKFDV